MHESAKSATSKRLIHWLVVFTLLAIPVVADAHLYALPAAFISIPLLLIVMLFLWPFKASITAREIKQSYWRVLGNQFLSSFIALFCFLFLQAIFNFPLLGGTVDLSKSPLRPFFALFWVAMTDHVQWEVAVAGAVSVLVLFFPVWGLENQLLSPSSTPEETRKSRRALGIINLVYFSILALLNGFVLYIFADSAYNSR